MTDTANREESTHEYRHIEYRHSASQPCGIRTRCNSDARMSAHRHCLVRLCACAPR